MADLAITPLHAWHVEHGGRMVDFAGWSMPVQYKSIVNEHSAARQQTGLFDVSHMGRLFFSGATSLTELDRLVTRRVDDLKPGQIRYGLLTNDAGCALDDILVYHVPAAESIGPQLGPREAFALLVVNAGNRVKAVEWMRPRLSSATFHDATTETAMIAVQGPQAMSLLAKIVSPDPNALKYYHCSRAMIAGQPAIVSRTGYTGEDGCELIVPGSIAATIWRQLIDAGAVACGLGCRDTLRLEAAMPLYGHELNEQTTPLEAALGFAVTLKDRDFCGSNALRQQQAAGLKKVRIGLVIAGKRAPREHYPILNPTDGSAIGEVTSGSFSPTLQTSIAMGYVPPAFAAVGTQLIVDIRGEQVSAEVVKLPFYSRPKA